MKHNLKQDFSFLAPRSDEERLSSCRPDQYQEVLAKIEQEKLERKLERQREKEIALGFVLTPFDKKFLRACGIQVFDPKEASRS
jgi:hypothetical protein